MFTRLCQYISSSIGKKNILALTGLALCGFLVSHLAGNFLILYNGEAFNRYGHALITNPLVIPAEIGLLLIFLMHLGLATKLALENLSSRPKRYHIKVNTGRGATLASNTMPLTGLIILIFLVLHLIFIKWGPHYIVTYDGVEMRDLYKLIMEAFSQLGTVVWYVFAVICLGIHVTHGLQSAFQSLGMHHPRYSKVLRTMSLLYGLTITAGYSLLPIYCYIKVLKGGNL